MATLSDLYVVQVAVLAIQEIELGCQFDHVVAVAALRALPAEEHRGEVVPAVEMLPNTVAADGAAAPANNVVEKFPGGLPYARCRCIFQPQFAGSPGNCDIAHHNGDLRVGVKARK